MYRAREALEGMAARLIAERGLSLDKQQELRGLQHWLEMKPDTFFESEIGYRSTEGKERRNWVRDVLTHMMGHMVHHRGQVSAAATRLGAPAPEMDYIYYKRAVDSALAIGKRD